MGTRRRLHPGRVFAALFLVGSLGAAATAWGQPAPEPAAPTASAPASAPPAAPEKGPAEAGPGRSKDPDDTFLMSQDDPRVPSFLRALRLGKDSLLLGGFIQPAFFYVADTDFNEDDTDGFDFNNARILGMGDLEIYEGFGAGFRFNFDVNRGNFSVRDVYGTLHYRRDLAALDVGQLKTPFGASLLQSEAKLQLPISPITRRLTFGRDLGVQARSDFPVGPAWFHVAAMIANGEQGFRARRNLDNEFVYIGRIEVAPLGRMERTEPDLNNSDFQLTAGFSAGHNSALTNDLGLQDAGAQETKFEGDLRMWFKGATLRGEYIRAFRGENESGPGFSRYGLVVQAGYVLPIPIPLPQFEIVGRFQMADVNMNLDGTEGPDYVVDNTETRVIQIGLNAYLAKHAAKVQAMYQLTDLLEGPMVDENGDVLIGDAFMMAFQFAWL
jgi:hypothetical protein